MKQTGKLTSKTLQAARDKIQKEEEKFISIAKGKFEEDMHAERLQRAKADQAKRDRTYLEMMEDGLPHKKT